MANKVETLRRKIRKLPGSHVAKAKTLKVSPSWVTKFLAGEIQEPRAARYEQLQKILGV